MYKTPNLNRIWRTESAVPSKHCDLHPGFTHCDSHSAIRTLCSRRTHATPSISWCLTFRNEYADPSVYIRSRTTIVCLSRRNWVIHTHNGANLKFSLVAICLKLANGCKERSRFYRRFLSAVEHRTRRTFKLNDSTKVIRPSDWFKSGDLNREMSKWSCLFGVCSRER